MLIAIYEQFSAACALAVNQTEQMMTTANCVSRTAPISNATEME